MRQCVAVLLIIAVATTVGASEEYAPAEEIFGPPFDGAPPADWAEGFRRQVVAALNSVHRDDLLTGVVKTRVVAGELWFDLRGITVRRGEISRTANLSRICWDGARFEGVDLTGANFSPALLRRVAFMECILPNTNFEGDHLESTDFIGCDLRGASLRQTVVSQDTRFANSKLDGAVFDHMVGPATFSGDTAADASFLDAELAGGRFNDTELRHSNFMGATLDRTEWFGSRVDQCDFREASLAAARLTFAGGIPQLGRTVFFHTQLANLNIQDVDVSAIRWYGDDYRIGEEIEADSMPTGLIPHNKENLYRVAESFYRSLARKYRDAGYFDEYLALRYRALETRRKILRLYPYRPSAELLWLDISRYWDDYGTNLYGVLQRYVLVLLTFAMVYLIAWLFNRRLFKWEAVAEPSREVQNEQALEIPRALLSAEARWSCAAGVWQHARVLPALAIEAVLLSLETSLLFAQPALDYRRYMSLIRMRKEKLVPGTSLGATLVFVEASLGVLLAVSLVRRLALLIGT